MAIKQTKEFTLPEKWYVKGTNYSKKNDTEVKDIIYYFNSLGLDYGFYNWCYYFNSDKTIKHDISNPPSDHIEISIEQFRKYVMNQDTKSSNIIAYKSPKDLFGGVIQAGTRYIKSTTATISSRYCPENRDSLIGDYSLPKEIVETWEPIYEEKYKVGEWVIASISDILYIGRYIDNTHISDWWPMGKEAQQAWNQGGAFTKIERKATIGEITSYLIKEAKKRGFTKGTKFYPISTISAKPIKTVYTCNGYSEQFEFGYYIDTISDVLSDVLSCGGNIYCRGVWAEIIKEEKIKIDKYTITIANNSVFIDNKLFSVQEFVELYNIMRCYESQAIFIKIIDEQVEVDFETIEKIYNKLIK